MLTIIIFLLILSLLVLAHEFGHFITARRTGMRVYEFGLGFPPRGVGVYRDPITKKLVWVFGKGKSTLAETVGGEERVQEYPTTLYSLNWLPLGGFCKIKGENGEQTQDQDSFSNKSAWARLIVLVAGVMMNIILAAVILVVGYRVGLPVITNDGIDPNAHYVEMPSIMVQQVVKKSPAEVGGIQMGDKIVSLDGKTMKLAGDVTTYIRDNGVKSYEIAVSRKGVDKTLNLIPKMEKVAGADVPRLGLSLVNAAIIRYDWGDAIIKGIVSTGTGFVGILVAFGTLLINLVLGHGLVMSVSGPVGIASVIGDSARLGMSYLLNVTAMISLSLAVINILPLPALDGGRALFVIIEKIFRKPVPMKYEQLAHTIGFVLLMILVVIVTVRDVFGLIG